MVVLFESVRLFVVLVPLKTKERMCTLGTPVSYAKSLKQTSHHVEITPLRASPAVWQIELASLIFDKNVKNTPPTVWQKTWQFLAT